MRTFIDVSLHRVDHINQLLRSNKIRSKSARSQLPDLTTRLEDAPHRSVFNVAACGNPIEYARAAHATGAMADHFRRLIAARRADQISAELALHGVPVVVKGSMTAANSPIG
jgi:hypothetical protein